MARRDESAWSCWKSTGRIAEAAAVLPAVNLRSLGAIHLASALALGDELAAFVTYDAHLADAPRANRLPVVAPRMTSAGEDRPRLRSLVTCVTRGASTATSPAREVSRQRAAGWRGRRRARPPGPRGDGDRGEGRRRPAHGRGAVESTDARGATHEIKDPFAQATRAMHGLKRAARKVPDWPDHDVTVHPRRRLPRRNLRPASGAARRTGARSSSTMTTWRMRARGFATSSIGGAPPATPRPTAAR